MAPGSFLVVSHATAGDLSPDAVKQVKELYAQATAPGGSPLRPEIARFFGGLKLVPPGIADATHWHAGPLPAPPGRTIVVGGVGRRS
jgi:S-adenosyl methyltransferase